MAMTLTTPDDAARAALAALQGATVKRPQAARAGELRATIFQAASELADVGWGVAGHITGMTELVPLADLWENPLDPVVYDEEEIAALAVSMHIQKQREPLIVVRATDPRDEMLDGTGARFLIVNGRKRLKAAARAGIGELEVIERPFTGFYQAMLESVTNRVSHHRLSELELGRLILRLKLVWSAQRLRQPDLGPFPRQQQLAALLGASQPTVSRWTRLAELPEQPLTLLDRGDITDAQAQELLPLTTAKAISVARELAEANHAARAAGGGPVPREVARQMVQRARRRASGSVAEVSAEPPASLWLPELAGQPAPVALGYLAHDLAAWLDAVVATRRAARQQVDPALIVLQKALAAPAIAEHIASLQPSTEE